MKGGDKRWCILTQKALQPCKLLSWVTCTCSSTHTPRTTSSRHTTHVRLPYRRYGLWKEEESAASRLLAAKLLCPQNDGRSILWASEVNPEVRWRLASLFHSFHTHAEPLPATKSTFRGPAHPTPRANRHRTTLGGLGSKRLSRKTDTPPLRRSLPESSGCEPSAGIYQRSSLPGEAARSKTLATTTT